MPGRKSLKEEIEKQVGDMTASLQRLKGMESHLQKLRKKEYCDVALKPGSFEDVEEEIFYLEPVYGHKRILEAASPYFENLFSKADATQHDFCIEGIDKPTLEFLLNCIYNCTVSNIDVNNMFQIYKGAHLLQLSVIEAACEKYIERSRNIGNCLQIWLFGTCYDSDRLRDGAFIIENLVAVSKLDQFKELTYEQLKQLISSYSSNCTADEMLIILYQWVKIPMDTIDEKQGRIQNFLSLVKEFAHDGISHSVFATVFLDDPLLKEDAECQKFRDEYLCEFFRKHIEGTKSNGSPTPVTPKSKKTPAKADSEPHSEDTNVETVKTTTKSSRRRIADKNGTSEEESTEKRSKRTDSSSLNSSSMLGVPCVAYFVSQGKAITIKSLDFRTGNIETITKFQNYRPNGVLLLTNNWLYYFGGKEEDLEDSSKIDVFDMVTGEWKDNDNLLELDEGRCYFNCAVLKDMIYVVAGYRDDACIDSVERIPVGQLAIRPLSDDEEEVSNVRWPKNRAPLVILDGKMYSVAGAVAEESHDAWASGFVEYYDPTTNEWTDIPRMKTARVGHAAAALNSKLYVMGGGKSELANSTQKFSSVEAFDPKTQTWEQRASMQKKRHFGTAVASGGYIYVLGGDSVRKPTVERYDPTTDTWTLLTSATLPPDADYSTMIFKVEEISE